MTDSRAGEKSGLSSVWDGTTMEKQGKHGGSSTALDDPLVRGMSPEEFASHEEWERSDWDSPTGGGDKKKKKKKKKGEMVRACVTVAVCKKGLF